MNFNVSTIVNSMGSHSVCTVWMYQYCVLCLAFEQKHVAEFLIFITIHTVVLFTGINYYIIQDRLPPGWYWNIQHRLSASWNLNIQDSLQPSWYLNIQDILPPGWYLYIQDSLYPGWYLNIHERLAAGWYLNIQDILPPGRYSKHAGLTSSGWHRNLLPPQYEGRPNIATRNFILKLQNYLKQRAL